MRAAAGVTAAGALLLAVATGCVTTKEGEQFRSDIDQLTDELAATQRAQQDERARVEAELSALSKRVDALESTLRSLRQADADTGVQMEQVIAELQLLRGDLERAQHELGVTREELEGTKSSVKEILERPPPQLVTAQEAPRVDGPAEEKIGDKPVPKEKDALYQFARAFYDEKAYQAAIDAFSLFAKRYPDDKDLLDNAWFWKGEAHYAYAGTLTDGAAKKKALQKAVLAYQKVLDLPGSNKVDGALFKIGLAFEQLGYKSEAEVFYKEIVEKHRKSPLVGEAKKRLSALKKTGKKGRKNKKSRRRRSR